MTPAFSAALALLEPKHRGRGWVARCPAHDDQSPSLNIDEVDGRVVLFCHSGCNWRDVVATMGLTPTDLFDEEPQSAEPIEEAVYPYRDETDSVTLFEVVRYRPKAFRQRRLLPDGRVAWNLDGVDRVPYRLPQVVASDEVIVVEGEKDADRLASLGLTATTNPSGASKWRPEWDRYFAGKSVIIIPDNDEPGRKHAAEVTAMLPSARRVRTVELPGVKPKGDVSDWLDAGHTLADLRALLDETRGLRYERMGDIDFGEDKPMALSPFVLNEGPCILFGDGGSGKSTLALCLAASIATGEVVIPDEVPAISGPVMWLDYESQRRTTAKRLHLLGMADAPILYVPGLRPIYDDLDRLTRIAEVEGIELVVVDSVVLACGGSVSPKDAEAPTMYANAVAAIAPRSIGLAHVVKSTEDDGRKPFGSGYWHNIARLTWHVKRDESQQTHVVDLANRKRNDGEQFPSIKLAFDWSDGLRVVHGPEPPRRVDQIADLLAAEGPLTMAAIGAKLGMSRQQVRGEIVVRHSDLFEMNRDLRSGYDLWSLRS